MMNVIKKYLNDIDWNYHFAVFKEGGLIFAMLAASIIVVCAFFATLITLFGWAVLPFLFVVIISVYSIWMIGNISLTTKKWKKEKEEQ